MQIETTELSHVMKRLALRRKKISIPGLWPLHLNMMAIMSCSTSLCAGLLVNARSALFSIQPGRIGERIWELLDTILPQNDGDGKN